MKQMNPNKIVKIALRENYFYKVKTMCGECTVKKWWGRCAKRSDQLRGSRGPGQTLAIEGLKGASEVGA